MTRPLIHGDGREPRGARNGRATAGREVFAITYAPALNRMFGAAPITPAVWLRVFAIALAVTTVVAIDKGLRQPRVSRAGV